MYYLYILKNDKARYYIGSCEDLEKRLSLHNAGRVKSTKSGMPWKLVHKEEFENRNEAYKREMQVKSYKGGKAFKKILES